MKPFNFEKAKLGYPVCLKNGDPARIICCDRKVNGPYSPIVALVKQPYQREAVNIYLTNGKLESSLYPDREHYSRIDEKYELMMTGEEPDHISNASEFIMALKDQLNRLNSYEVPIKVNGKLIRSVELTEDLTIEIKTL